MRTNQTTKKNAEGKKEIKRNKKRKNGNTDKEQKGIRYSGKTSSPFPDPEIHGKVYTYIYIYIYR
ncbi:hypothetical protein I7I53_05772 [Histoplasma capsulatum var. duboisii H88]|uniref:Uncharacterized protein n=1 Tax=Ajellomyces capsulatus (strain H88) TaxID=544711 RepID=A0A8A1LYU2_AJEC8|nr:hypothetical protein I7I53_05772 [Histoplasma capsulatum var. duboisii H88]